jgi:hypothetical protein
MINLGLILLFFQLVKIIPSPMLMSSLTGAPIALTLVQASKSNAPMADATYLYGQSRVPEQIGQEYLVFKVSQGKVVGAIYMPSSEFNCFYGTLDWQQMNISIVNPYDNSVYPHSIALQQLSPIAAATKPNPRSVGLQGYQAINSISDNDKRILGVCLDRHK